MLRMYSLLKIIMVMQRSSALNRAHCVMSQLNKETATAMSSKAHQLI